MYEYVARIAWDLLRWDDGFGVVRQVTCSIRFTHIKDCLFQGLSLDFELRVLFEGLGH